MPSSLKMIHADVTSEFTSTTTNQFHSLSSCTPVLSSPGSLSTSKSYYYW